MIMVASKQIGSQMYSKKIFDLVSKADGHEINIDKE